MLFENPPQKPPTPVSPKILNPYSFLRNTDTLLNPDSPLRSSSSLDLGFLFLLFWASLLLAPILKPVGKSSIELQLSSIRAHPEILCWGKTKTLASVGGDLRKALLGTAGGSMEQSFCCHQRWRYCGLVHHLCEALLVCLLNDCSSMFFFACASLFSGQRLM